MELVEARDTLRLLRNLLRACEKIDGVLEVEEQSKLQVAETKKAKDKLDKELEKTTRETAAAVARVNDYLASTKAEAEQEVTRIRGTVEQAQVEADKEIRAIQAIVDEVKVDAKKAKAAAEKLIADAGNAAKAALAKIESETTAKRLAMEDLWKKDEAEYRLGMEKHQSMLRAAAGELADIQAAKAKAEKDWDQLREKLASVIGAGR